MWRKGEKGVVGGNKETLKANILEKKKTTKDLRHCTHEKTHAHNNFNAKVDACMRISFHSSSAFFSAIKLGFLAMVLALKSV